MKRMHVGLKADDLEKAIEFYSGLFGTEPTMRRPGYAKWMLDDPRVNFSLDTHGEEPAGTAHYGIQVECHDELTQMRERLDVAGLKRRNNDNLICGYQQQAKSWVDDPHGILWETFFTSGIVDGTGYGCGEGKSDA